MGLSARHHGPGIHDESLTATRTAFVDLLVFNRGTVVTRQDASDGTQEGPDRLGCTGTSTLPLLDDPAARDRRTETVMIPTERRRTACVSSQVGCPVGCRFCASGLGGLDRNLTAGHIVEQVHHLQQLHGADRITNIVFMGMGEPLANAAAVFDAIRTSMPTGGTASARGESPSRRWDFPRRSESSNHSTSR